ncbi:conserved membrane hypothetical protein [Hyella patelloides LEGE 07179]|uniref:Uncharacterized protein n=1 Tax=Hyella patelloides LEGE 07179 TaxID=945734 RepID=A0A563VZ90_9CYAN|nr:hypothetical protein [Hyella patelloides]VEP16739.1 conserved membrane hypothetical protein [Hyella patelloides LEGE 07179]
MKPKFTTLIILVFLSAAILAPFAVSHLYEPIIREQSFDFLLFIKGNLYKQITGYISLVFVILEMVLVARKRGRGWIIKIKIPGSIKLWRKLHIFLGVGLLAIVLVHTIGLNGLNFNAIFLSIFFAVSLSALVGVTAETGVVESPQRRFFSWLPNKNVQEKAIPGISKSTLIRNLRSFWLGTHIILVAMFFVMLAFHIFLAYYYQ